MATEIDWLHVQDIQYDWNSNDLALVSVSPRSCKACAFFEDRKFPLKKVCIFTCC